MASDFDVVIRGGLIVDGTGGKPFRGDVGIVADRIAAVGDLRGDAAEVIDARDRIVAPGFVDVHTHYDGQLTWENTLAPSSGHGVTTVAFTGEGGGRMGALADHLFAVGSRDTARIQEAHILAGHMLCDWLELDWIASQAEAAAEPAEAREAGVL